MIFIVNLSTLVDHLKSTFFDMTKFLKFGWMRPETSRKFSEIDKEEFWSINGLSQKNSKEFYEWLFGLKFPKIRCICGISRAEKTIANVTGRVNIARCPLQKTLACQSPTDSLGCYFDQTSIFLDRCTKTEKVPLLLFLITSDLLQSCGEK